MPEVQNTFEPRREHARNRNMVTMKVVNRNTRNLTLPDGQVVQPGESTIMIYEDNVGAVDDQVENDEAAVKAAHKQYKLLIAEQLQQRVEGQLMQRSAEDVAGMIERGALDRDAKDKYDELLRKTGASVESEFFRANKRGIKPLISAEILERNIPEPQRKLQHEEWTRQAQALAIAMREAWGGNGPNGPPQGQQQSSQNRKQ